MGHGDAHRDDLTGAIHHLEVTETREHLGDVVVGGERVRAQVLDPALLRVASERTSQRLADA